MLSPSGSPMRVELRFDSVLEEWVELPAIGPEHLTAARQTKHAVTGNLDAPVVTYPDFKGSEKHFLKTQLVRMMFNCELVPTGMYRPKEDAKEDEKRKLIFTVQLSQLKLILSMYSQKLRKTLERLRTGFTTTHSCLRQAELLIISPNTLLEMQLKRC